MFKKNIPLILIILLQVIIFSSPHIFGVLHQNEKAVFTGQYSPNNEKGDILCTNCFYLIMGFKQSYDGAYIIEDKFQGYKTHPKIIHPWWILGGHLSRLLNINIITFNLLQRLLWTVLGSIVVFLFAKRVFKETKYTVFAVLFFNFSSYLTAYTPEGSAVVANLTAVVLPLATLLLATLFYLLYKFTNNFSVHILLSVFTLLLVISYPYSIIPFSVSVFLFFAFLFFTKQRKLLELIKLYGNIFIPAFLVIAYDYFLVFTDQRLLDSQSHVYSDSLKKLLIGYLPFTFFAGLFMLKLFFKNASRVYKNIWVFFYIFIICSILLTQIPTSYLEFSMQMIVGIQLPLIFITIEYIRQYVYPKLRIVLLTTILIVTIIPSGRFYADIINNMESQILPSYLVKEIHEAAIWLDENVSKQSQLLCVPQWSSYIGIYSGTRLYIGEDVIFTPDYNSRLARLENSLKAVTRDSIKNFIQKERIDYIFYDKKMKNLDENHYLLNSQEKIVFENPSVKIIQTKR